MSFILLAFPALFAIVNPIGGAFVFMSATQGMDVVMRSHLARWVAIHSFAILNVSIYVGAYVLEFFGISLPVLRVAGGVIIALSGWKALTAPDDDKTEPRTIGQANLEDASRIAFFPLTMPITAGPGAISVAVALGTSRPTRAAELIVFLIGVTVVTALISLLVYVLYRNSLRVSQLIGPTGTSIIVRLSSFVLFCIGIQVLWSGVAELVTTLPTR
jgi:multiple antibiotic resistance protein